MASIEFSAMMMLVAKLKNNVAAMISTKSGGSRVSVFQGVVSTNAVICANKSPSSSNWVCGHDDGAGNAPNTNDVETATAASCARPIRTTAKNSPVFLDISVFVSFYWDLSIYVACFTYVYTSFS